MMASVLRPYLLLERIGADAPSAKVSVIPTRFRGTDTCVKHVFGYR